MTEPPRPPGDGTYGASQPDPTAPQPPPASYPSPGEAPAPGYAPPPTSGPPYSPPPAGGYAPPPGGYAPPPGGPFPPAGGYPPGPGAPSPGYASSDDKTWALLAHFGGAVGAFISGGFLGFVGPLIAYLVKGQQSPTVRAHAVAALNFQILWSAIAFVVLWFSWCLAFIPSIIVFGIQIVFSIIAGVKANEGQLYRYPMSLNVIK